MYNTCVYVRVCVYLFKNFLKAFVKPFQEIKKYISLA